MPTDIAFKVGDQLRCINKMSGNGIVVARSAKDGDITYTVFTDFGNIIGKISELDMLNQFEVIEVDPDYQSATPIHRWLIDRAELIKQQYDYAGSIGLGITRNK